MGRAELEEMLGSLGERKGELLPGSIPTGFLQPLGWRRKDT